MAFIFVDLFASGRFDRLKVHQVKGFTNQVSLAGGTILDGHDPPEVHPEVPGPFLYGFFTARVK